VSSPGGRADVALPPGEEGELVVDATADARFTGYLNDPEATAAKLVGGWYRTGDSAYLHPSGDVVLTGRIDDMINSGGENVHPEEVEAVLARHPAVREAAVVGVPDPRWGEVVIGCVMARIGKPTLAAVTGPAVGGGLGMVLACDLAVRAEGATFLPAWMAIGIANDAGTSFYLSRIVGYRRAMEWLLTNRTLDAAEALEWGVVNRV
jgi:acyl-CoA synthetase (AMP-forming)/AMP-acid ligase II